MADEKLKIKIIPEYLPHYIGEVEIDCLPLKKIKTQADMFDVIEKLRTLLIKVNGAGFMSAILPTDELLEKISVVDFMFMEYKDGKAKLNRDEKYKQLTAWFSESLELKIAEYTKRIELLPKESPNNTQVSMQIETPIYIQDLIETGLLSTDMRCLQSLNKVAAYIHDKHLVEVTPAILKNFKKKDGSSYGHTAITNAVNYAKSDK